MIQIRRLKVFIRMRLYAAKILFLCYTTCFLSKNLAILSGLPQRVRTAVGSFGLVICRYGLICAFAVAQSLGEC